MALSGEQIAQLAYQAGFRGEDLINIVAIAKRESGYNPAARRTDNPGGNTGDFGLLQINSSNWGYVSKTLGLSNINQLLDPAVNMKAAFLLYKQYGLKPWAAGPGGWTASGNPLYGTNVTAARSAVTNAQASGLLGTNWQGGTVADSGTGTGASGTAQSTTGKIGLPSDAKVYNILGSYDTYAVFDLGGVTIAYKVDTSAGNVDWGGKFHERVTRDAWNQLGFVDGGDALELGTVQSTFGSYKAFWDSILAQVMGFNNPAKDDPEVRRVLAEFAARPDMTPAELQNRLEATQWWQTHTTGELEWNGLADAEKAKRRDDMAARMVQTWQQFTGEVLDPGDPRVANYLEQLSSGKMGIGAWTETVVKKAATDNPNSPYSRDLTAEQQAQKQPGIDIENTALKVRQTLERWGLQWSEGTIQDWARRIVNKDSSDDDLMNDIKMQAQVMYAWKPPDMETMSAAAPWMERYRQVMEKEANLQTPEIQAALTAGTPVWEFEQGLKRSSGWLETKNARDQLTSMVGSVGKMMGFA